MFAVMESARQVRTSIDEIGSLAETLREDPLQNYPDARVEEDYAALQRAMEVLEAERFRRLADIERRRSFERDGYLSAAAWLADVHRVEWGSARDQVRIARALEEMPETRRALEGGQISMSAVRVLAAARGTDASAFERSEPQLVAAATIHPIRDLQRVVLYWRQRVESERCPTRVNWLHERRRLHASVTLGGMVRVDGDLDPETGETLLSALGAVVDAEARSRTQEDVRTPAQRRADALGEICRQWLTRRDRPTVAGERPHLVVTVSADALQGGIAGSGAASEGVAELDHGGPVHPEVARRVACDASLMRVVMSGASQPLDVGRRTPVVPPAMRRAVVLRDRGCRFPGCDRPPVWCDAHHIVHWAHGGPTALHNLLLLCRRHHRLVHEHGGFTLESLDGQPVFRRPDGSALKDRAPP